MTTPRADGLPNMVVLLWFPAVVVLGLIILTALSISGTSSAEWTYRLGGTEDPNLLVGDSRPIRSDEWYVQSSWVVSQVAQGFPATNTVFPGGMDATVFNDLPSHDWSTAFRPHLWALLVLPLDPGMAARWWVPGALVLITAYCFVVTVLPRAAILGAVIALTVLWQPTVQWWWLPVTLLPIAFSFAAMTAVIWALRSERLRSRIVWAAIAGYLAVTMVMSIYAPYIVAGVLAATAVAIGYIVHAWRTKQHSGREILARLAPLAIAAVAAGGVAGVWLMTRRETVSAVLDTVYPGQRSFPTGTGTTRQLVDLLSAPFQRSLQLDIQDGLSGGNQSENAAPLLISIFLIVPMVWWLISMWRRQRRLDWVIVGVLAAQVLVFAFIFISGWDTLAKLLLLDRSAPQRLRPVFVILAAVSVVTMAERLKTADRKVPWIPAVLGGATAVLATAYVWRDLDAVGSSLVPSTYAIVITLALAIAIVLVARQLHFTGSVLILACAALVGAGVNPLYRGVVDLGNDSPAGRAVSAIAEKDPEAAWVGVGSVLSLATLVETGTHGYSGVQTYPPMKMWDRIDPSHQHEEVWNRLAHVSWQPGTGEPAPHTPSPDQILMTFDSCGEFAQKYVTYALVDGAPLDQPCVTEIERFSQGPTQQWIYRVTPKAD